MNEIIRFSNYTDYLAAACGRSEMSDDIRTSRRPGGFGGTQTFEEAVDLARHGWLEGAEKVKAVALSIRDKIRGSLTERPSATWDVTGADVDVGRFVIGEPECMIDFVPEVVNAPAKFLRLTVNISVSAGISQDEIIRKGAAAVALVDCLEEQGYRCEVDAVEVSRGGQIIESSRTVAIRLKEAGEPVEIDRLAFVLAHPASERRIQFSLMETWSAAWRQVLGVPGSYSRPGPTPEELRGDINVEALSLYSEAMSAAWVLGQLRSQGIEIEEGSLPRA